MNFKELLSLGNTYVKKYPDRPFHNLRAPKAEK